MTWSAPIERAMSTFRVLLTPVVFVNRKVDHLIAEKLTFSPAWPEG
jgi:hypothetical protein